MQENVAKTGEICYSGFQRKAEVSNSIRVFTAYSYIQLSPSPKFILSLILSLILRQTYRPPPALTSTYFLRAPVGMHASLVGRLYRVTCEGKLASKSIAVGQMLKIMLRTRLRIRIWNRLRLGLTIRHILKLRIRLDICCEGNHLGPKPDPKPYSKPDPKPDPQAISVGLCSVGQTFSHQHVFYESPVCMHACSVGRQYCVTCEG